MAKQEMALCWKNMLDPGVKSQISRTSCLIGEESLLRNKLGFGGAPPSYNFGSSLYEKEYKMKNTAFSVELMQVKALMHSIVSRMVKMSFFCIRSDLKLFFGGAYWNIIAC